MSRTLYPIAALVGLLLAGCGRDEPISQYTAPKSSTRYALAVLDFARPANWTEVEPPKPRGGIKVDMEAAFALTEATHDNPEVTITLMDGGLMGGLLANVNRWRTLQLGLKEIKAEQLGDDVKTIKTDAGDASWIDLQGGSKRMLVGLIKQGRAVYIFKLLAPNEVAAKHQAAFEAFVKSAHFTADEGAN